MLGRKYTLHRGLLSALQNRKDKPMIMTDEQRRWWFATHPEYRSGRKQKKREPDHEDEDTEKMSPEAVDAWADEALKHERDPVQIVILQQAKYWFGTEFAAKSPKE
jgi:hypothetical protein